MLNFIKNFIKDAIIDGKILLNYPLVIPETEELTLSCLTKAILTDLKKLEDWDAKYDYYCGITYYINIKKKYRLSDRYNGHLILDGLETVLFTDREESLIRDNLIKIYDHIKFKKDEEKRKRDLIKLKKLFPECYKKDYEKHGNIANS